MNSIAALYELYLQHPNVQTDTRLLTNGSIFFALKGDNFDGNQYALQALEKGAAVAVVDDEKLKGTEGCWFVENALTALQQLATFHRKQLDIPVLAITGSNGKTTTKELLSVVLTKKYTVLSTKGNLNNHIGVPLTILRIRAEHNFAIIEMGANHQKEINAYCNWAMPQYALVNNCGKAHLEGFGGIEGVRKGKGELYDYIKENGGTIFRNADYAYLKEMSAGIEKQITYGEFAGSVKGKIYEHEPFLKIGLLISGEETIIPTQLMGDYNLANVLAALCVGQYFGVETKEMVAAITAYKPSNNRSEHRVVNGVNIILDAYNANPASMRAALNSFSNINQPNKIVILGAMMELGQESEQEHLNLLEYAQRYNLKNIVTVGDQFKSHANKLGLLNFRNADDARTWFWANVQPNDWVYIKGSRLTAMEKIVE